MEGVGGRDGVGEESEAGTAGGSKEEGEAQQGGLPLSGNYFNFYPLCR